MNAVMIGKVVNIEKISEIIVFGPVV